MKNFLIAFSVFSCWCVVGLYFLNATGAFNNRKSLFVDASSTVESPNSGTIKKQAPGYVLDSIYQATEPTEQLADRGIYQDSSLAKTGNYDKLIDDIQKRMERNQRAIDEDEERLRLAKLSKTATTKATKPNADITFRPVFKMARLVRDENASRFLAEVERRLKIKPQAKIEIIGYTDHIGDDRDNYVIALEQAQKIRLFLIKSLNLPENQVIALSKGEEFPLYPREQEDKIELNNRYELIFK